MIVEDEPLAMSVVESFCKKIPSLEIVAKASDGISAVEILKKESIDLLFIDINMPNMSGIEVVRILENPPLVIFTTAYQNYAITGFELSAIDYLIKPFSFDRFFKAVNRAQKQHELICAANSMATQLSPSSESSSDFLMVKVDYSVVKIKFDEIVMFEGLKDYVKICTKDRSYVTKNTMKNIEQKLAERAFMRVHKSFIINLDYVESFENNHIMIGENSVPLGSGYKDTFMKYIAQNRL